MISHLTGRQLSVTEFNPGPNKGFTGARTRDGLGRHDQQDPKPQMGRNA